MMFFRRPSWFAVLAAELMANAGLIGAADPAYLDRSVNPCDDFYAFANGGFFAVAIPEDHATYGVNEEVDNRNFALLRDILEQAARDGGPPASIAQRLGDFYATGMDETAINAAGLNPLQSLFELIAAIPSSAALPQVFGQLTHAGFEVGFAFAVTVDDRRSTTTIARLTQGGMGLPDRAYYFADSPEGIGIRDAYVAHIAKMLTLAGDDQETARTTAAAIMALETRLASAARPLENLQDPHANYHKYQRTELSPQLAALDWAAYFDGLKLPPTETEVIVGQPEFFPALVAALESTPLKTWQAYLRWQVLSQMAPALGSDFEKEHFAFYGAVLSGAEEMKPLWQRVLAAIDAGIGEDLGRLYVTRAFSPAAKARALAMVHLTLAATRHRITGTSRLAGTTKEEALRKIDRLQVKVGYPDVWRDYRDLKISRPSYAANVLAARAFAECRQLAKLGHPVDRTEWQMTPATNNAYYDATLNEVCFPAGILQPPFFDAEADAASNFGGIGATIGHELTHGFDESGRQYDADGNLHDWWTAEDAARFNQYAGRIETQYKSYEALPGLHLNGRQTLGENIADIGGLLIAYDAFRLAIVDQPDLPRDSLTRDQRFFIAFAQSWRTNARQAKMRLWVASDVHSPPHWRVIGAVSNVPAFYEAFGCPAPSDIPGPMW